MSECPYLTFKESLSCQACTGYSCLAYGRSKKLSDVTECKGDYWNCQRYLDAKGVTAEETITGTTEVVENYAVSTSEEATPEVATVEQPVVKAFIKNPCGCGEDIRLSNCPYQSTKLPDGRQSCTGVWCYANNKSVRVPKNCWNWQICTVYLMSKYKGVPYP